jgi:hypothetical protein
MPAAQTVKSAGISLPDAVRTTSAVTSTTRSPVKTCTPSPSRISSVWAAM